MKDTTIFILCATAIALFAIYKGQVNDVENIINVIVSACAGCAVGYSLKGYVDKKQETTKV